MEPILVASLKTLKKTHVTEQQPTQCLPTIQVHAALPKLRVEDDWQPKRAKQQPPEKNKFLTNIKNLSVHTVLPNNELRLTKAHTVLERPLLGPHIRVDPRMGFKKVLRETTRITAMEKNSKKINKEIEAKRESANNSVTSNASDGSTTVPKDHWKVSFDRSRTDLKSRNNLIFRGGSIVRSRSFFHTSQNGALPKHTDSSTSGISTNESGSSAVSSLLSQPSSDASAHSLPLLTRLVPQERNSFTVPSTGLTSSPSLSAPTVYFKNNKYDLVKVMSTYGVFSQETSQVVSSSRKSAYGRGPRQFVIKRLPMLDGNKKETVTKVYENFNDLTRFKGNVNLNRLVDTYLSNYLRFFFVIQEFCASSLEKRLAEARASGGESVSASMAMSWFKQAVQGVRYLHETCQILHANIKPSNILFSENFFLIFNKKTFKLGSIGKPNKKVGNPNKIKTFFLSANNGFGLFLGE
jgi:hypothetical protein